MYKLLISKALRYVPCVTRESHSSTCHPHTNHTCRYSPAARHHRPLAALIATTHEGMARLSWPGPHTEINVPHRKLNLDTVTHFSTNRARRWLTSLIEANALTTACVNVDGLQLQVSTSSGYVIWGPNDISATRIETFNPACGSGDAPPTIPRTYSPNEFSQMPAECHSWGLLTKSCVCEVSFTQLQHEVDQIRKLWTLGMVIALNQWICVLRSQTSKVLNMIKLHTILVVGIFWVKFIANTTSHDTNPLVYLIRLQ